MEQQNNSTAVAEIHENTDFMLGLNELKARANMVTEIKRQIMKNGTHFGVIPGCGDKPTLLKNGAELLCMAFKLAPEAKVEIADLGNGHREYTVTTTLVSIATGTPIATGLGSCSTMESKYRYRNVSDFELTGQPIPADAKERKQEYRRQGYGMKKVDGAWEWVRFKDSAKAENPDIADQYNTVLKMASKRSLVDATLKATGGSCEFTQDIEDMAPQGGFADYQDMGDEQPAPQQPRQNRADPKAQLLAAVKNYTTRQFAAMLVMFQTQDAAAHGKLVEWLKESGWAKPNLVPADRYAEVVERFYTLQEEVEYNG